MKLTSLSLCLSSLAPCAFAQSTMHVPPARAPHAMVVSIHHEASEAGLSILRQGGNAVDAAVAVGFALAVVYPQAGNLGGGGFMLIRPATKAKRKIGDGVPHFIDYREKAPAAATADMYLDANREIIHGMSTTGYKASGVPGSVAGMVYAESHFGRLGLKAVMQPAIRLAREGYILTDEESRSWGSAKNLAQFPESHRIFQRDGNPYRGGDRFTQPELASTLERIAADPTEFYKGRMAQQIADAMQKGGGLITAEDMAAYEAKDRSPLVGKYRGYDILTAPPPSSGGIVLLETLNILSGFKLNKAGKDRSPGQVHLITEAFRRAYMDRGDYLGDPDFTPMPLAQLNDRSMRRHGARALTQSSLLPRRPLSDPQVFCLSRRRSTSSPARSRRRTSVLWMRMAMPWLRLQR